MIRIQRAQIPRALNPDPGPDTKKYDHLEVIRAIFSMQHSKCCYCEKDLGAEFPESSWASRVDRHIEHFKPKSPTKFPQLKNTWSNLLLACSTCNVNKLDKFPTDDSGDPLFIDPCDENTDPEHHLDYEIEYNNPKIVRGQIKPLSGSLRGESMIDEIGLYDPIHVKRRKHTIRKIYDIIIDYNDAINSAERQNLIEMLKIKLHSKNENAGIARCTARFYFNKMGVCIEHLIE